ncbi:MAG: dihydroneopterin aldolase, partial [Sutterellaceae bacterium]|nr:dihydroneopterin aldolase [Sutterellaceae bacterium]
HIGVYDEEKGHTQPVIFTVDVWVPLTDEAQNYWDYTTVVKAVDAIAKSGHIGLQEEIHEALFQALFADDNVCAVRILTKKTKALSGGAAAAVETFKFTPNAR